MKDIAIKLTEATALAKASGLRNCRERILLALLNEELPGERGGASWWVVRSAFESWLEGELDLDRAEDKSFIRLPEARSLARLAGVDSSADRVLQAVMSGEVENSQRDGAGWQIPREGFEEWLGCMAVPDEVCSDEPELPFAFEVNETMTPGQSREVEQHYGIGPTQGECTKAWISTVAPLAFAAGCWVMVAWMVLNLR